VMKRRWGDCDDLAPCHAASLRASGEDPGATAIVKRSGPKTWHAVVKRSDGSIDDPSRRAGMGQPHEYHGAVVPIMPRPVSVSGAYIVRPNLALRPVPGGVQARADMPWFHWDENSKPNPTDYAMASLHRAPVTSPSVTGEAVAMALSGAIEGAVELGVAAGFAHPDHVDRLCCIHGYLNGYDFSDMAHVYGEEEAAACQTIVGSFLSHFNPVHLVRSALHNPLTSMAANFVPGGRAALDVANMIPGFGHAAPGAPPPLFPGMNFHCTPFG